MAKLEGERGEKRKQGTMKESFVPPGFFWGGGVERCVTTKRTTLFLTFAWKNKKIHLVSHLCGIFARDSLLVGAPFHSLGIFKKLAS